MVRTIVLTLVILVAAALSCASAAGQKKKHAAPNVVLVMADDLGWGDVGYNGHPVLKTPHLDAMARSGVRFDRFYAPTVCSPTRGSVLTGRHPYRYGIFGANSGHLRAPEVTLAEILRQRGYRTGHFGKWHVGTLTRTEKDANRGGPRGAADYAPPWEHGFDTCFSTESKVPTWDPYLKPKNAGNKWWDPVADPAQAEVYGTAYWTEAGKVAEPLPGDDSRILTDRALPFIRESARAGQPFLAVVWFHAPHWPVVAGPEHTKLYPGASRYEQHYYGCITALDEQVGRLRRELRTLGVAGNTMLWFCSDNGPEGRAGVDPGSSGPFKGRKRDLWEGGIRVPGLLEWPDRFPQPKTVAAPCATQDTLPTVLDYLGLPEPAVRPQDGMSLRPLLEDRRRERNRPISFENGATVAWLEDRYKLVATLAGRGREKTLDRLQLFDLPADPGEERDLAPQMPERVERMRERLETWRASCRRSLTGADYPAGRSIE